MVKKEVFSFDRLLFTLSFHLNELSLHCCKLLLQELEAIMMEEFRNRAILYGSNVQDVRAVVQLPIEGRVSVDIPEALATYDDQRICTYCQHTCFLSAVCCNCRFLLQLCSDTFYLTLT